MIDYTNLDFLAIEFQKRRVYGDPRDFDLFEAKASTTGPNCKVLEFAPYSYPELKQDPENIKPLSVESIKNAFREFIRFKITHSPEATSYHRIDPNKHTFMSVDNSMLVSFKSYQMMLNGRKHEYYGGKNPYETDPHLKKIVQITQEKNNLVTLMNEGKLTREQALEKALPLQQQINELENEAIKEHIESHLGPIANTLYDTEEPALPIQLHVVPPTKERPYGALVTSGMSPFPMMAPSMAAPEIAELFMLLPPDWPLPLEPLDKVKRDEYFWPIFNLLDLVKYVHSARQWFSVGHTFGNGDPPRPFAKNTKLCAFLFKFPYKALTPTFCELRIGSKPVYFLQVVPIYREELEFIIANSMVEFESRFLVSRLPEYTVLDRENIFLGEPAEGGEKGVFCRECGTIMRGIDPSQKQVKCKKCGAIISIK